VHETLLILMSALLSAPQQTCWRGTRRCTRRWCTCRTWTTTTQSTRCWTSCACRSVAAHRILCARACVHGLCACAVLWLGQGDGMAFHASLSAAPWRASVSRLLRPPALPTAGAAQRPRAGVGAAQPAVLGHRQHQRQHGGGPGKPVGNVDNSKRVLQRTIGFIMCYSAWLAGRSAFQLCKVCR